MPEVTQTKVIRPGKLDIQEILAELQKQLQAEGKYIQGEYAKTTQSWKHKPKFEAITDVTGGQLTVLVGTDDEIFGYVDQGTRPHDIVPKPSNRRQRLFFREGYVAKTTPGVIASRAGGPFGKLVVARRVRHPGTKAREFSKTIQAKTWRRFKRNMEAAMKRGAEKAQARMAKETRVE